MNIEDLIEGLTPKTEEKSSPNSNGSKSKSSTLSVKFPDGTIICEKNAIDTLILTIEKIGFDEVMDLGLTCRDAPLIDTKPQRLSFADGSGGGYKEYQGYYFVSNSSTDNKISQLQKISDNLGLNLVIKKEKKMAIRKDPKNNVKCEVVEKCGVVSERANGEKLEVRYISWNGKPPKYDIRPWRVDDDGNETCGKGLTLTGEELEKLGNLIQKMEEEN